MPIAPLANPLTDLRDVKEYLGQSVMSGAFDAVLQEMIVAVENAAESFCNRKFRARTFTHDGTPGEPYLDGTGNRFLMLPNPPIISISALHRRFDEDALVEGADEDFVFDPWTGEVEIVDGQLFPSARKTVKVVYRGGFADGTDPAEVRTAYGWAETANDLRYSVIRQVGLIWKRMRDKHDGIESFTTDGGTFNLSRDPLLPDVRATWNRYRLRPT